MFGKESEHNLIKFLDKTLTTQTATGIWAAKITKAREHILQFICTFVTSRYSFSLSLSLSLSRSLSFSLARGGSQRVDDGDNDAAELIDFLGTRIQDHALEIKDICIGVFRKDTSNTARSLTFPPIAKLIKLGTQQLDADALNVKALAEMYLQEYAVGASKLSQTLKSDILELLGLLCEIFPERMFDKSNTLLQLYLSTIQKEFTADEPKMQIIAGSLTGLTSLLIHFSGDFLAGTCVAIYEESERARASVRLECRFEIPLPNARANQRTNENVTCVVWHYSTKEHPGPLQVVVAWLVDSREAHSLCRANRYALTSLSLSLSH